MNVNPSFPNMLVEFRIYICWQILAVNALITSKRERGDDYMTLKCMQSQAAAFLPVRSYVMHAKAVSAN